MGHQPRNDDASVTDNCREIVFAEVTGGRAKETRKRVNRPVHANYLLLFCPATLNKFFRL